MTESLAGSIIPFVSCSVIVTSYFLRILVDVLVFLQAV